MPGERTVLPGEEQDRHARRSRGLGLWIEVRESRVAEDRFGARCGENHVLEQPGAGAVACGGDV